MRPVLATPAATLLIAAHLGPVSSPPLMHIDTDEPAAYTVDILNSVKSATGDGPAPVGDVIVDPVSSDDTRSMFAVIATSHTPIQQATSATPITAEEPGLYTTTSGYELLSYAMDVEEFTVAGVTWSGTAPTAVDMRTFVDGAWSEWNRLDIATGHDLDGGTDPFMSAGATGVQIRMAGTVIPTSIDLALMTGETTDGSTVALHPDEAADAPAPDSTLDGAINVTNSLVQDATIATASLETTQQRARMASVSVSTPDVISRSEWGAPKASWKEEQVALKGAIIHHTAGTNNYSRSEAPGIVRGIFNYHANTLDWGDIGYNFLIDKYGTIYEGRSGSLASPSGKMVIGGHAAPANTGSVGISVMGNFTNGVTASAEVLNDIAHIIAWQFGSAGLDPHGTWRHGGGSTIPTISGHQQVSATACPGTIQNNLPHIRTTVETIIDASSGEWIYQNHGPDGAGWYYLTGGTYATGWLELREGYYWLNSRGKMTTGFQTIDSTRYLFDKSGLLVEDAWSHVDGVWYWSKPSGALARGWLFIDGDWYFFDSNYRMRTGWVKDGSWYYLTSSGAMATGLVTDGGTRYYLDSRGAMVDTAWILEQGAWYWARSSGVLATGWQFIHGTWYYFSDDHTMHTGWLKERSDWFYLNSGGAMVTGRLTIDGLRHTFAADGRWLG